MALGPKLWHKIKQNRVLLIIAALVVAVAVAVAVVIILIKVLYGLNWTGFRGRTLWDWLQLLSSLAIPIAVAFGTLWFTTKQTKASEAQQEDQQQEAKLQAYLDKMYKLSLHKNLHMEQLSAEESYVASVRTRITLHKLDPSRKRTIIQSLNFFHLLGSLDLKEADLSGANLSNTDLSGANLSNTDLSEADLSGANLSNTDLSEADLSGASLNRAILSNAILHKAILSKASFVRASLNFSGLSEATLREADLSSADLHKANMRGADLRGANLSGANLSGANLSEASMGDAILDNVSLVGASISDGQINETKSRKNIVITMQLDTSNIDALRKKTPHTGTYTAALIATIILVPVLAPLLSIIIYTALPQSPGSKLIAILGGTILALSAWLLVAIPLRRLTAVDRANMISYEELFKHLNESQALFTTLQAEPNEANSLQTLSKEEVSASLSAIYLGLTKKSSSWILGTGYVDMWRLMHRVDEAFIDFEPTEVLIHNALYEEMSLLGSTIENNADLLNKLRTAVKKLNQGAGEYLNQQAPQDDQTKHPNLQAASSAKQNTVNPKENDGPFSNTIDSATQARSIIREVSFSLHQFRDDRLDALLRTRNQLMGTTLLIAFFTYMLVVIAILVPIEPMLIEKALIFYFLGAIIGFFSRLYDEAKTDKTIADYGLSMARIIVTPLLSGLAAVGAVLITQLAFIQPLATFELNLALEPNPANLIIAAVFGLIPSLFVNILQRKADQIEADLKSTQAHP